MRTSEGQTRAALDLRAFIDSVLTIAWSALPDGSLDFINQRFRDYTGLSSDQLTGWEWKSVVHPDDIPQLQIWWQDVRQSEEAGTTEKRLRRRDGAYRWFRIAAAPVHDEQANLVRWCGINTDIDDLKQTEEGLRASERSLRQIVDCVPGFVCTATAAGEVEFFNQQSLNYFGKTLEDLKSWTTMDVIHPADLPQVITDFRHSIETGQSWDIVHRLRRADGVYRWFQSHGVPERNADGRIIRWFSLLADIEDRKRAEDKIREQETELRQMLDLTPQLVAVFGPNRERIYANRGALDYVGLSLEEWRQIPGGPFRPAWFIHPDDRERAARADSDSTRSGGSAYELELRVQGADGSYRWFLLRFNPVRDEHGQIMRWYAAATDIDDRKRTEEQLRNENLVLREEIDRSSMFEEIVGSSKPVREVLKQVEKVAPSDSTVLILGETGTGKELIARALHRRSKRATRAFVRVNCAAIPQSLIASELFGHEKGAFTGALQRRVGRFEAADGGTLFLDEIGDLPTETQIALLRVLQERELERVGSNHPILVDVRLIAATNRDLSAAVASGSFRQDLFYRLNVVPIAIPSLRERAEDIPLLVEYFVGRYASAAGKNIRHIGKDTLEVLRAYHWPGNIRELQNVVERAVILNETDTLVVDESWLKRESADSSPREGLSTLADREVEMIETALAESHGRVSGPSGAAAKLGIPRQTLESKIRRLGIDKYGQKRPTSK
jgi:formate hydrogenlyase transcriptional activator